MVELRASRPHALRERNDDGRLIELHGIDHLPGNGARCASLKVCSSSPLTGGHSPISLSALNADSAARAIDGDGAANTVAACGAAHTSRFHFAAIVAYRATDENGFNAAEGTPTGASGRLRRKDLGSGGPA